MTRSRTGGQREGSVVVAHVQVVRKGNTDAGTCVWSGALWEAWAQAGRPGAARACARGRGALLGVRWAQWGRQSR